MNATAPTTKDRILEAAEELILTKSFHSVGLKEILDAVKVPKGSFYHYFSSKEQFGVELLKHYVAEMSGYMRRVLLGDSPEPDPLERLITYLNGSIALMVEKGCKKCCLVLKLGAEVATMSDDMRQALAEGMTEWRSIYERVVVAGQAHGTIRKDLKPGDAAAMVHDYWMGALQRMLVERNPMPLRTGVDFIRKLLAA